MWYLHTKDNSTTSTRDREYSEREIFLHKFHQLRKAVLESPYHLAVERDEGRTRRTAMYKCLQNVKCEAAKFAHGTYQLRLVSARVYRAERNTLSATVDGLSRVVSKYGRVARAFTNTLKPHGPHISRARCVFHADLMQEHKEQDE